MSGRAKTKAELEAKLKDVETTRNVYQSLAHSLLCGEKPVPVKLTTDIDPMDAWAHLTVWVIGGHRAHGGIVSVSSCGEDDVTYGTWSYASDWCAHESVTSSVWGREMARLVRRECERQNAAKLKAVA